MGYRYLIEIDIKDIDEWAAQGHQPIHITELLEKTFGVKVKSLCAKGCPECSPIKKNGCTCGKSNFVEGD
jgi:hypothetical protein